MVKKVEKKKDFLGNLSVKITNWVGTPASILVHTLIFITFTILLTSGLDFNKVILIWNTTVSLEAIYLALFIQMTVNRNTQSLEAVEEDIDDIQEDVEDLSEDIEEIQDDEEADEVHEAKTAATLEHIQLELQRMVKEVESLKKTKS